MILRQVATSPPQIASQFPKPVNAGSKHRTITPSIQENWFQKLVETESSNRPKELINYKKIEPWIKTLNELNITERKKQVTQAIKWLSTSELVIEQMILALHLIEKTLLSQRVSRLSDKNFYTRQLRDHQNRDITLAGLKNYIDFHHRGLIIDYLQDPKDVCIKLEKLKQNKKVWIILKHGESLHKSLCMISIRADYKKFNIYIWDSLGFLPNSDKPEKSLKEITRLNINILISKILRALKGCELGKINSITEIRQKDSINCSSFVLYDLTTALILIKSKAPLFSESYPHRAHDSFFGITQNNTSVQAKLIKSDYLRELHLDGGEKVEGKEKGNCQALLISAKLLSHFLRADSLFSLNKMGLKKDIEEEQVDDCKVS